MAEQLKQGTEKPLCKEDKERVWDVLHKNMCSDDRYPLEVMMGPPYNGDRSAYCNAMRGCLNNRPTGS